MHKLAHHRDSSGLRPAERDTIPIHSKGNTMKNPKIHTIDLNFLRIPQTIAVYLIPHQKGAALIECGPGSTIPTLTQALAARQLAPQDITDVFVTHIHLDHAGSAGWWARQGARIHVHHIGGPHLIDPSKLIASARRIYGSLMDQLWGELLPIPPDQVNLLQDNDEIHFGDWMLKALDTPGHANHHMSYLLDGVCFSGDVGGVHLPGVPAVRLPTVPPEFHIEKWRQSIQRFRSETIHTFATTHFGLHEDARWHLDAIERELNEIEKWTADTMSRNPSKEEFRDLFARWINLKSKQTGLSSEMIGAYDTAISSQMSADGIFRYWHKHKRTELSG